MIFSREETGHDLEIVHRSVNVDVTTRVLSNIDTERIILDLVFKILLVLILSSVFVAQTHSDSELVCNILEVLYR